MNFVDRIRNGTIAPPTKPRFDLSAWEKRWAEEPNKDSKNAQIYEAGKVIFSLLEEIRCELKGVLEKTKNIPIDKLLIAFFSMSNRDNIILLRSIEIPGKKHISSLSIFLNNNPMQNDLSLEDIANGSVDNIEKAVKFRIDARNSQRDVYASKIELLSSFEYVAKEVYLSQLYGIYESYWHALLWNDFSFDCLDEVENIYSVSQSMTDFEMGYLASINRKSKIVAQSSMALRKLGSESLFKKEKYVAFNSERKEKIYVRNLGNANQEIQSANSSWMLQISYVYDVFTMEKLATDHLLGFSILEACNVFRMLMLLSIQIRMGYPQDDEVDNLKQLSFFCQIISKSKLRQCLIKTLGYDFKKVSKILNFISFDGAAGKDLWCHPIIEMNSSSSYIFLTSALVSPNILRVAEHWISQSGMGMGEKGAVFEENIVQEFNISLQDNNIIEDYDAAVSGNLKIEGHEEVDFLCRIGKKIIVGEAKSVVTTDSPISSYRTWRRLGEAACQLKRKVNFIRENERGVFDILNWKHNLDKKYEYTGVIINSSGMFCGNKIDGFTICDIRILTAYFKSKVFPILSYDNFNSVAWIEFYKDFIGMQEKFDRYLDNLPQIDLSAHNYDHKISYLPIVGSSIYKIMYKKLVMKELSVEDHMKRDYGFPLVTVDSIEDKLKEADLVM